MNHVIADNNIITQTPGYMVSNMAGETVMMSMANGKYYNLGTTGGRIWELITSPALVSEIVASLSNEYDIHIAECEQQVITFLQQLASEGLIQIRRD